MLVFLQFSGTSSCRQQRHFKQFRNISSWYVLFPSRLWCNYCYASNKTCKTESFKRIRALCITNSIGIAKIVNLSKDLKTNVPKMHQGFIKSCPHFTTFIRNVSSEFLVVELSNILILSYFLTLWAWQCKRLIRFSDFK